MNAEQIVAHLTDAQKAEVRLLSGEWKIRRYSGQQPSWEVWLPPRIMEQACPTQINTSRQRLTPLGLKVRALLENQP